MKTTTTQWYSLTALKPNIATYAFITKYQGTRLRASMAPKYATVTVTAS
ncbi:MAG: hypothetical protein ABSD89_05785 [Halobacteriota archaeon]